MAAPKPAWGSLRSPWNVAPLHLQMFAPLPGMMPKIPQSLFLSLMFLTLSGITDSLEGVPDQESEGYHKSLFFPGPQCSPSVKWGKITLPGFSPRHGGSPGGGGFTHLSSRVMVRLSWLLEQSLSTRWGWPLSLVCTWMLAWISVFMCISTMVLTMGLGEEVPDILSTVPAPDWSRPAVHLCLLAFPPPCSSSFVGFPPLPRFLP